MLDDHARRFSEGLDALQGSVRIGDVVVGQRLALKLLRGGDSAPRHRIARVERCLLVGILAVAHGLPLAVAQVERLRQGVAAPEIARHGAVVGGGVAKRLGRKTPPHGLINAAGP